MTNRTRFVCNIGCFRKITEKTLIIKTFITNIGVVNKICQMTSIILKCQDL